ncbi:MAG: DUF1254 domain-containing protein [Methyloceanibacter sp.]
MRVTLPGRYIVLCLLLAGLIHVIAVLTLPLLAPRDAHARLAALGPANSMIQIPAAGLGRQIMPMMAPDVRYAVCHYDLANGPVRVKAMVPDDLWMVALYTPEGVNFYAVAGADLKRPEISLIIAMADQSVAEASVDAPDSADDVVVVNSPVTEGIVLIRAPLAGPSRAIRAEQALKNTYCGSYGKPR